MTCAVLLVALLLALPAGAETYVVGNTLPELSMKDQHGEPHAIGEDVRGVLFSRDMDGGGVLRKALEQGGADLLKKTGSVYVADVSRMPGLVRRFFALPRLRRRGYPVLLDEDGSLTKDFPSAEGKGTLIELKGLRITRIRHFSAPEELAAALRDSGTRPAQSTAPGESR
jgi:hypothetical protein